MIEKGRKRESVSQIEREGGRKREVLERGGGRGENIPENFVDNKIKVEKLRQI